MAWFGDKVSGAVRAWWNRNSKGLPAEYSEPAIKESAEERKKINAMMDAYIARNGKGKSPEELAEINNQAYLYAKSAYDSETTGKSPEELKNFREQARKEIRKNANQYTEGFKTDVQNLAVVAPYASVSAGMINDISTDLGGSKWMSEYAEEIHGASQGKTQNGGDRKLRDEAKQYAADTNKAAANIETGLVTAVQLYALQDGIIAAEAVEGVTDALLKMQGEAPARSLRKIYSPIPKDSSGDGLLEALSYVAMDVRGDDHYHKGGLPGDHPDVAEHRQKMAKIVENAYAKHGLNPDGTSLNQPSGTTESSVNPDAGQRNQATSSGRNDNKPGLFGIWSLVGAAALGVVGLLSGGAGWIVAALIGVGVLTGQMVANTFSGAVGKPHQETVQTVNSAANNVPIKSDEQQLTINSGLPGLLKGTEEKKR